MKASRKKWSTVSFVSLVGFFFAVAPVLDPYIVVEIGSGFTLKINDVIMIFLTMMLYSKSYSFNKKTGFLCIWIFGLGVIGFIGNLVSNTDIINSAKNMVVWSIYAFCLGYLWKVPCRDEFLKWVCIVATIASIIVILQYISGYIGTFMWAGKIPGLTLSKYDGWAGYIDKNTGDIRPNGIFQEASYLGIYVSIAYVQAFKEEKMLKALLFSISMLMTTSLVAIVILVITTLLMLIMKNSIDLSSKTTRKIILLIGLLVLGIVLVSASNEAARDSITYIIKRFTNFNSDLHGARMSSTKYRIIGHVDLFEKYTLLQRMFGVGIAQYGNLFSVKAFSNVWVTTLLNCGILGVCYLIICIFYMFKRVRRDNLPFFIIFILVLSSDWQWFNWYFFMLISACILLNSRKSGSFTDSTVKKSSRSSLRSFEK